jgi:hypothetical protein
MAADKPEGDPFLSLLDAKIAALQGLREGYLKALSLGALGQPGEDVSVMLTGVSASGSIGTMSAFGSSNTVPMELPTGAFLNKSIPEAIKLYLSAVKKKQTTREIAIALKDGGMETTASNWETTVTGALHRLKAGGVVLRFKDGWALADFYPDSLRTRLAKDEKPRKRGRPKKATPVAKAPRRAIHLGPGPIPNEEKAS